MSGIDTALPVTFTLTHMVTCQVHALKQDTEQPAHFFVGDLDAGMYAATITSGDRVVVKKVVVK